MFQWSFKLWSCHITGVDILASHSLCVALCNQSVCCLRGPSCLQTTAAATAQATASCSLSQVSSYTCQQQLSVCTLVSGSVLALSLKAETLYVLSQGSKLPAANSSTMLHIEVAPPPPAAATAQATARRILSGVRVQYMPSSQVARKLHMSSRTLGKITGQLASYTCCASWCPCSLRIYRVTGLCSSPVPRKVHMSSRTLVKFRGQLGLDTFQACDTCQG